MFQEVVVAHSYIYGPCAHVMSLGATQGQLTESCRFDVAFALIGQDQERDLAGSRASNIHF
ncbi:hypothetical protein ACU8KH_04825 [Lachancea thermotolerans]